VWHVSDAERKQIAVGELSNVDATEGIGVSFDFKVEDVPDSDRLAGLVNRGVPRLRVLPPRRSERVIVRWP